MEKIHAPNSKTSIIVIRFIALFSATHRQSHRVYYTLVWKVLWHETKLLKLQRPLCHTDMHTHIQTWVMMLSLFNHIRAHTQIDTQSRMHPIKSCLFLCAMLLRTIYEDWILSRFIIAFRNIIAAWAFCIPMCVCRLSTFSNIRLRATRSNIILYGKWKTIETYTYANRFHIPDRVNGWWYEKQ